MATPVPPVSVVCAGCAAVFTLRPAAHARRVARHGAHLLCSRCLADGWLRTWQGAAVAADLLRDDTALSP
jgi:hypothetical protein